MFDDDERLRALEARLAAVESALGGRAGTGPPADAGLDPERFWVLRGLADDAATLPGGAVVFAGRLRLPTGEEYAWQRTTGAEDARGDQAGDDELSAALSALAHPVRLRLLREILTGRHGTAELAALPGLGTTGQLHHHLRQLVAAGWLRATARGSYAVPAERIVPLHVVLAAGAS